MPTKRVKYVEDHENFGRMMLSDQMHLATSRKAYEIMVKAKRIAQWYRDTGHLARSYKVITRATPWRDKRYAAPHATSWVYSNDPAAWFNEFGGGANHLPKRRILRKAGGIPRRRAR